MAGLWRFRMKLIKLLFVSSAMLFTSTVLANYLALVDKGFILLGSSTDLGDLNAADVVVAPSITAKKTLKKKVMKKKVTSKLISNGANTYLRGDR